MATILVNGQPWEYEETSYLTCGSDVMDHEDAKYILLTAKKVLDENNVPFMLMYGTLLGAIRDNGFIKNDHDMDLLIFEKDRQNLINSIPDFAKHGVMFTRKSEPWVYTFQYKNASCDFYVVQDAGWPYKYRYCRITLDYIQKSFFQQTEKFLFLNEQFDVPKNPKRILEYFYGKNWRIPQRKSARAQSRLLFHMIIKKFIKRAWSYIKRHFLNNTK